jgi:nucleotide-binding universal stress UspA family protein
MYNTILFPTDGSEGAEAALEHATDAARQHGATLHLLFVAQKEVGPSGMVGEEHDDVERSDMVGEEHETQSTGMMRTESDLSTIEEQGQAIVGRVAESIGSEIPVETAILQGNPHERIIDYADENGVDLIVMGTHGRTGVDRYLLGSVTERVVRTADAPVLTVRMDE